VKQARPRSPDRPSGCRPPFNPWVTCVD
jgi:hypothetical protein